VFTEFFSKDGLAKTYEISGGHIKEAVLRAASLAMASEERRLTQRLLVQSCNMQYKNLGKLPVQIPARRKSGSPQ